MAASVTCCCGTSSPTAQWLEIIFIHSFSPGSGQLGCSRPRCRPLWAWVLTADLSFVLFHKCLFWGPVWRGRNRRTLFFLTVAGTQPSCADFRSHLVPFLWPKSVRCWASLPSESWESLPPMWRSGGKSLPSSDLRYHNSGVCRGDYLHLVLPLSSFILYHRLPDLWRIMSGDYARL